MIFPSDQRSPLSLPLLLKTPNCFTKVDILHFHLFLLRAKANSVQVFFENEKETSGFSARRAQGGGSVKRRTQERDGTRSRSFYRKVKASPEFEHDNRLGGYNALCL